MAAELRKMSCQRGLLSRADGSAQWAQEGTCVIAAVHGPQAAMSRVEDEEKAAIEVVFRPRSGLAGTVERQNEQILRKTLEGVVLLALFPRTLITLVLQVVSDDGSVLSCALNAACAALVDAGIPMRRLFAAMSCALDEAGTIALDPTSSAEQGAVATACVAYTFHSEVPPDGGLVVDQGALTVHTVGSLTLPAHLTILEVSRAGCEKIAEFMTASIARSFTS